MGMITRSALLMKLAIEHRPIMFEVFVNFDILIVLLGDCQFILGRFKLHMYKHPTTGFKKKANFFQNHKIFNLI